MESSQQEHPNVPLHFMGHQGQAFCNFGRGVAGKLLGALMCEYMEWAGVDHSLKVFLAETNLVRGLLAGVCSVHKRSTNVSACSWHRRKYEGVLSLQVVRLRCLSMCSQTNVYPARRAALAQEVGLPASSSGKPLLLELLEQHFQHKAKVSRTHVVPGVFNLRGKVGSLGCTCIVFGPRDRNWLEEMECRR